jgi:pimeloyl-ACP methyl ester carboxylesterase
MAVHWYIKAVLLVALTASPAQARDTKLGTIPLSKCTNGDGHCGSIRRPLDPTGGVPGTINIGFRWFAHLDRARPSKGTVVVIDGGPGFGATHYAADYAGLFEDVRSDRDVMMVDNRGTGASDALSCPALDRRPDLPLDAVRLCGAQLGQKGHLFGAPLAADDLAAVLDAAALPKVELYSLSYGTYFAQVFAARHPERLTKLIMDSAYPVRGGTSFFETQAPAMRAGFALACERSPTCDGGAAGWTTRFDALLKSLRQKPVASVAPNHLGKMMPVRADAPHLFTVMMSASMGRVAHRELDAAARAYLEENDSQPLMRLIAETLTLLGGGGDALEPADFSPAAFVAVSCSDYPKLFDMRLLPEQRRAQLQSNLAAHLAAHPDVYAPFSFAEFRSSPFQENSVDLCLDFPWPGTGWPVGAPIPVAAQMPAIPTLVLNGEFDTITTVAEGQEVARQFPNALFVKLRNGNHASPVGDLYNCGSVIIRKFLDQGTAADTACSKKIPDIRTVGRFAKNMADISTRYPQDKPIMLLARIAAATGDDALARTRNATEGRARGLRGGSISIADRNGRKYLTLKKVRWVQDARVDGVIIWNEMAHRADANLTVRPDIGSALAGKYDWNPEALDGIVQVVPSNARSGFMITLP